MKLFEEKKDSALYPTPTNADELADFIMFAQRSFLLDLSKKLNEENISYAQLFLLGYLSEKDYLTMTDISKKMGHSTAAATGLVDRLEKIGHVQRLHAADDRRKVMVQITRKGVETVSELRNCIAKNISSIMLSGDNSSLPVED